MTFRMDFGYVLFSAAFSPRRRCRVIVYRVASCITRAKRSTIAGCAGCRLDSKCSGTRRCSRACVKFRTPCCCSAIMRNSPSRATQKGLPTFRAGGVASCIDSSVRAEEGGGSHKTALTPTFFSHDHFSSSLADTEGVGIGRWAYIRMLQ